MDNSKRNLGRNILCSGAALMSSKLLSRTFDLIRLLTIARWLGPIEMGVYAVASLVLTALDQLSETGLKMALIQRQGDVTPYLLPVRTIQALRGLCLGLAVYISAPWVASFFNSPSSLTILKVIALLPIIRGLEPLYATIATKELNFKYVVILQSFSSLIGLLVGIITAYNKPDAWALVWASLSSSVINTVGAHLLSNRQSNSFSFNWKLLKDLRSFGFWIFINCIMSYIFIKGGDWLIGHLLDVKSLALYQMAFFLCTFIIAEIGNVVSQLTFPVFSKLQYDQPLLQQAFRQSFGFVSVISLALAGLMCVAAADFFALVLGQKWQSALPLIPWLSVWGVSSMFSSNISKLFHAMGHPKLWAYTVFCMTALMVSGIYPMVRWHGALGVAILLATIGVTMQFVRYRIVSHLLGLPTIKIASHVLLPSVACIFSVVTCTWVRDSLAISNPLVGPIFSIVYFCTLYICLLILGKAWMDPSLPELFGRIRQIYRQTKTTPQAESRYAS